MSVMMKYAYQNGGGNLSWKGGPPRSARAADLRSLGSLAGSTLGGSTLDDPTLVLPAPGAPEPIGVGHQTLGGCSCRGSCGCGTSMGDLADSVPGGYLTLAAAAFLAWKFFKRRR